jgi:hypothetical protein
MPAIGSLKRAAGALRVALVMPGGSLLVWAVLMARYACPAWSGGASRRSCFRAMGLDI